MDMFSAVMGATKRKETRLFLMFTLYPLMYFVASFFKNSNFMQINVNPGDQIGYIDFLDMMLNTVDAMILPTIALCFLTISVFKREVEEYTLFLFKDINRQQVFWLSGLV